MNAVNAVNAVNVVNAVNLVNAVNVVNVVNVVNAVNLVSAADVVSTATGQRVLRRICSAYGGTYTIYGTYGSAWVSDLCAAYFRTRTPKRKSTGCPGRDDESSLPGSAFKKHIA